VDNMIALIALQTTLNRDISHREVSSGEEPSLE